MSLKTRPGLHAVKTTGQQGLRQLNSLSLGLGSTMKVTLFIVKTLQKHRPMPSLNALSRSCSTLMVAALAAVFTQLSLAQASNPDLKDPPPIDLSRYDRPSGLDLTGRDLSVAASQDLFKSMNGQWINTTDIPSDKSSYGSFMELRDLSDQQLKTLITELQDKTRQHSPAELKVARFYESFVDTKTIDRQGLAPLRSQLKAIEHIQSVNDLVRFLGANQYRLNSPIDMGVSPDQKQPTINRTIIAQGGLGMPDRDYYLKPEDARLSNAKAQYLVYLSTLAQLHMAPHHAGPPSPEALDKATRVLALESKIAQVHWSRIQNRDTLKSYNPMSVEELQKAAQACNWTLYLKSAQLGNVRQVIVAQPDAIEKISALLASEPLQDWKDYLTLQVLNLTSPVLPQAFRDARFAFYGQVLSGAKKPLPRWQQGIQELNHTLGEEMGRLYVARYFSAKDKDHVKTLVANLMQAYKVSIDSLTWMSPATQQKAQEKLAAYSIKIAYPDRFRDYSALKINASQALANRERSMAFEWARAVAKVDGPVDKSEWHMNAQTVNAYYNPTQNEIVFPAAILQPPFYNARADDAVNYGGIGAVIGHEISHGFDDQGSQYDGEGKLNNWWTPEDRAAFERVTQALVKQYDAYEPIAGTHVKGLLTLGENIADLSGLQIAFKAYQAQLGGKPSPVIDGLTGEQRFFLGFAQVWRSKTREAALLKQVTTDPHAPAEFRANGAAVNHDAFHEAFKTQASDGMYKAVEDRIRLW